MSDLADRLPKGIHSPFNACMYQEECKTNAAEIERLRADAARYRWLRSMFEERGDCWWLDAVLIEGAPSLETLEDAIDAAMKDAP